MTKKRRMSWTKRGQVLDGGAGGVGQRCGQELGSGAGNRWTEVQAGTEQRVGQRFWRQRLGSGWAEAAVEQRLRRKKLSSSRINDNGSLCLWLSDRQDYPVRQSASNPIGNPAQPPCGLFPRTFRRTAAGSCGPGHEWGRAPGRGIDRANSNTAQNAARSESGPNFNLPG